LQQITQKQLEDDSFFLYIHTPFCGTCHIARGMLEKIEAIHGENLFYEMNASLHPQFMQDMQVESVPCLLIKVDGKVKEKVYAFKSIVNIYYYLMKYRSDQFTHIDHS